jgi:hypothetical protein
MKGPANAATRTSIRPPSKQAGLAVPATMNQLDERSHAPLDQATLGQSRPRRPRYNEPV